MVLLPAGLVVPLSYIIAYIGIHATNAISMKQFKTKKLFSPERQFQQWSFGLFLSRD